MHTSRIVRIKKQTILAKMLKDENRDKTSVCCDFLANLEAKLKLSEGDFSACILIARLEFLPNFPV